MLRRALLRLISAGALCVPAAPLGLAAQAATPVDRPAPSLGKYLLTGAAVGVGVTVIGLAVALQQSDTACICSPLTFAPLVAGGAVVGALGGLVVYAGVTHPGPGARLRVGARLALPGGLTAH